MAEKAPEDGDALLSRLARLPPGRHGLPRDFVAANHRDRLLVACAQEVQERGYRDTTVAHIIKTAAVSRRTFYEFFESKEACFLAVYDLLFEQLGTRVLAAFTAEEEWPRQVRAGLAAMLGFLAEEPRLARLAMAEPLVAGPPIADHHRESLTRFVPLLEMGREATNSRRPAEGTEEAVVAGIGLLITRRVVLGQAEQLEELLPDLVETALTPFLGAAEAERVARRPSS